MLKDPAKFKEFLESYLSLLEELLGDGELPKDGKFVAQLRTAERYFNFLLDKFPVEQVENTFGLENWKKLKQRRDAVAAKVSDIIESDPKIKRRYENYCENLKKVRNLGATL